MKNFMSMVGLTISLILIVVVAVAVPPLNVGWGEDAAPAAATKLQAREGQQFQRSKYRCTQDCSGHQAGYEWAQRKSIDNAAGCTGNSESFIEGCLAYVER